MYAYKNIYPNSMMHSSKLHYFHGEQRGAICVRQTWTTTSWHNKHPIMKCGSLDIQILAQGKPIMVIQLF
jgi:hypothetical protein